jgi:hypothetical protein
MLFAAAHESAYGPDFCAPFFLTGQAAWGAESRDPLLAQSGHLFFQRACPLSGGKAEIEVKGGYFCF